MRRTLPREYTSPRVQLWMGPNAHLVAYPISGARQINVVAIVPGTWNRPGWSAPGDANEIKNAFASPRWPATARMLIGAVDEWRRWALFTLPDVGEWSSGAIALLGDAAHAMLPFAAQGAGMAIEDAAVLARCLEREHRRQHRWHPGGAEALRAAAPRPRAAGAARRAAAGPHLSSHRARWRWRATSRSRRWARSACWRGRTGSTTGGREASCGHSGAWLAKAAVTLPRDRLLIRAAGLRPTAPDGRGRLDRRRRWRRRIGSGLDSWHLLRPPGFLGQLRLSAHRRCNRCDRRAPPPRSRRRRFRPWPSGPAIPRRALRAPCARSRAACNRRDRIWRDRRTPDDMVSPIWAQPDRPAPSANSASAARLRENGRRWDERSGHRTFVSGQR